MKVSVVIPTLWMCDDFKQSCDELNNNPDVGEVIVIDNNYQKRKIVFSKYGSPIPLPGILSINNDPITISQFGKFKVLTPPKNLYVTEPWNKGASMASEEIICILNDDVIVDPVIFSLIPNLLTEETGIIGIASTCFGNITTKPILTHVEKQPYGFGCCMFMKKARYTPIPETLKIYYNDNYLFSHVEGKHFSFTGAKVRGGISRTVHNPEMSGLMQKITGEDALAWRAIRKEERKNANKL